jgi:hypothetical protein
MAPNRSIGANVLSTDLARIDAQSLDDKLLSALRRDSHYGFGSVCPSPALCGSPPLPSHKPTSPQKRMAAKRG